MVGAAAKRVVIIGGVAGGASAAARLRRLDETAEITLFERGPDVSFANCGLPYYIGGVIPEERSLLVAGPELFRARFRIDVHTHTEVVHIDRERHVVATRDVRTGETAEWPWDAIVLAPGASPIRPPLPGLDLPGVFVVRSIPDTRAIRSWIERAGAQKAVVIGGGFIGLEMAENLTLRGLEVTVLEKLPQVMPPLDRDVATRVAEHLREHGVALRLSEGVSAVERIAGGAEAALSGRERLRVKTDAGGELVADLVILAIGVKPETRLAREAGIALGALGGIAVDARMQTSVPGIWAVGDVVEDHDLVLDRHTVMPLAGPANRQGRIAAEAIAGRPTAFRGVQATAIVGVFGLTVATTGASEKSLTRAGRSDFEVVHLHPGSHAGYYPGAKPIHLKLIFETPSGRILGAQAVGTDGVDKRIDVIAMALQMGGTVHDLAEAELCYAPQFGSAKDPVNVAGMIAANVLNGDMPQAKWSELETADPARVVLLDVRQPDEFARGHIPGAVLVPLPTLRDRLETLDRSREILVYCAGGQRAYFAQRFLMQHGFKVRNLPGGWLTYVANR